MLTLAEVKEILKGYKDEIRKRYKAEILGVFGSYARGEQNEKSDVDILVRFLEGATLFDLVELGDFLEEKLGINVDIVSENAVRKELRDRIEEDLVAL